MGGHYIGKGFRRQNPKINRTRYVIPGAEPSDATRNPDQITVLVFLESPSFPDVWILHATFYILHNMKLLALDTATEACSAALFIDGNIISRYEVAPRRHTELILPMIDQLLAEAETRLAQLDAIAFGCGPGAFTGVRIATGIAQGLAFSSGLPVIPVSTLATLAQSVRDETDYIAAAIDARMDEIYFGLYKSGEYVELINVESVLPPADLPVQDISTCYGVGSGWSRYSELLQDKFKNKLTGYSGDRFPHAKDMVPLAIHAYKAGALVKPEEAMPVYLRNKVTG